MERIGTERWDKMPRSNKWSFAQNLWQLTKQARSATVPATMPAPVKPIDYFIDRGKECIGAVAEIFAFFEYGGS